MYKDLFEKLVKVNEFGYEAKYREVEKLGEDGFEEVVHLVKQLGWPEEEIIAQVRVAMDKGVYLLVHDGGEAELRDLPGRIGIEMLSYDDDEQSLIGDRVEARFDPDDPSETLYISGETFEGDSL